MRPKLAFPLIGIYLGAIVNIFFNLIASAIQIRALNEQFTNRTILFLVAFCVVGLLVGYWISIREQRPPLTDNSIIVIPSQSSDFLTRKPISDTTRHLWNAMLDADMNVRYWGHIARRYTLLEKWYKMCTAVLLSVIIVSFQVWKITTGWFEWSSNWDLLSILALLTAISLPIVDLGKVAHDATTIKAGWALFLKNYERLWLMRSHLAESQILQHYSSIKESEVKHTSLKGKMPYSKKLIKKSQQEVLNARGLNKS